MCSSLLLGFGWSLMELDTDRVVAKDKQQECLHCKFSNVRQITLKKFSHTFHKKLNIFCRAQVDWEVSPQKYFHVVLLHLN